MMTLRQKLKRLADRWRAMTTSWQFDVAADELLTVIDNHELLSDLDTVDTDSASLVDLAGQLAVVEAMVVRRDDYIEVANERNRKLQAEVDLAWAVVATHTEHARKVGLKLDEVRSRLVQAQAQAKHYQQRCRELRAERYSNRKNQEST